MSPPSPSDRLLALFVPWMAERGFAYRKAGHLFRRPFDKGYHAFRLEFDGRAGFVTVHPAFAVCFDGLADIQARLKWPVGQAGRTLRDARVEPDRYDLYLDEYMNMTPRQRAGITSETTHPQARIEAGLCFLQDAYERYATPAFDTLRTEQDLADLYLRCFRGVRDPAAPYLLENNTLLLASRLEDRAAELREAIGRRAPWDFNTRTSLEKAAAALGVEMPVPLPDAGRVYLQR